MADVETLQRQQVENFTNLVETKNVKKNGLKLTNFFPSLNKEGNVFHFILPRSTNYNLLKIYQSKFCLCGKQW